MICTTFGHVKLACYSIFILLAVWVDDRVFRFQTISTYITFMFPTGALSILPAIWKTPFSGYFEACKNNVSIHVSDYCMLGNMSEYYSEIQKQFLRFKPQLWTKLDECLPWMSDQH